MPVLLTPDHELDPVASLATAIAEHLAFCIGLLKNSLSWRLRAIPQPGDFYGHWAAIDRLPPSRTTYVLIRSAAVVQSGVAIGPVDCAPSDRFPEESDFL